MKVAMLAPIAWRTPPRHYGPWELVTSLLTEELVKLGVDVTLFATSDSLTSAKLESVVAAGYEEDRSVDAKVVECLHISHCFGQAERFDLIHNQFDFLPLSYSGLVKTPVLTTIHGFSSPRIWPVYEKYNGRSHYVSISDADRHPALRYLRTIYHGIDLSQFHLMDQPGSYLAFMGRFHPDKGAKEAIEIALATGLPLKMAGIIQDAGYFDAYVKPHLGKNGIGYIGTVNPEQRNELLGGALALLHPIGFAEPFGLSVVESMACGTPVIAFSKGSMPELITNGENGFLVNTAEEAVKAVGQLHNIRRSRCRAIVEERFSSERMAKDYLEAYAEILGT